MERKALLGRIRETRRRRKKGRKRWWVSVSGQRVFVENLQVVYFIVYKLIYRQAKKQHCLHILCLLVF